MKNTLFISDTHAPYQHPDTFKFLKAVKEEYGIEQFKHSGDVVDNHFASYHEIEYGTLSAKAEYEEAIKAIRQLDEIVEGKLTTVLGNHCILSHRKAKSAGIPADYLKSYNDVYGVKWNWTDFDYFKINQYQNGMLTHAMSTSTLNNAKSHSLCTVQGHHHGVFGIEYYADTEVLRWSMTVGCLVNPKSPAFNYAKYSSVKRPIIGCGVVVWDTPILVPMMLSKTGRWVGRL